ncbi:MAG: hypothetical protein KDD33_11530 [Bdellovibrionales bacterium]|nr:hypothetical protein [Bdellovibrionales bacterium]
MKLSFLLSFLFLTACVQNDPPPPDEASAEQKELVDYYLQDIQQKINILNMNVNVTKLPVVVTEDLSENAAGECFRGSHIRIRKSTLQSLMAYEGNEGQIWRLFAHEIGHCYFGRSHYDKTIVAPTGFQFKTLEKSNFFGKVEYTPYSSRRYSGTVMSENYATYTQSESVRNFYLKELAGWVDGRDYREFVAEDGIDLIRDSAN